MVTRADHIREHFRSAGTPKGHGYSERNVADGTAYYAFGHGIIRCVVLDTVNHHGGWQGSIDATQLSWLEAEASSGGGPASGLVQPSPAGDPGQRHPAARS